MCLFLKLSCTSPKSYTVADTSQEEAVCPHRAELNGGGRPRGTVWQASGGGVGVLAVVVDGLGGALGLACTQVPGWPLICSVSWAKTRVRIAIVELGEGLDVLLISMGFSHGASGEEFVCQRRRLRLNPWVGKILWRRKWHPTSVFLPGEFHGRGA